MTKTELRRLPVHELRRIAWELNITIPRDFTRRDILEEIEERMGDDREAWALLGQDV